MTRPDEHPIIMWELTRACDLQCMNCGSTAADTRSPGELSTYESYKTVDRIASLHPREVIITGGDPLVRRDLVQIIDYARRRGLTPSLVVSPTDRLTADTIEALRRGGLTRMIFSIDGSTAEIHQFGHGRTGTFEPTLQGIRRAIADGLEIEINTLVSKRNSHDLNKITALIRTFKPKRWNLHFLVPAGVSAQVEMLTASEVERVFGIIHEISGNEKFAVRAIEAPHYRRFVLEREIERRVSGPGQPLVLTDFGRSERSTGDMLLDTAIDGAQSFLFITHAGDVRASEFLPHVAGNIRHRSLPAIYHRSDLFTSIRSRDQLHGKCGRCEFRYLCGGSRARAWAMNGDLFATDPLCAYEPGMAGIQAAESGRATQPIP